MPSVVQINPAQAFELLKNDSNSVLVDVRTFEEFKLVGVVNPDEFNNRMILLPWQIMPQMGLNPEFNSDLEKEVKEIFGDKALDAKLIFICRSGARSNQAASEVINLGYSNCYNLSYGFEGEPNQLGERGKLNGWKAESLPWRQK
jgi:rhodanese-related sulfurtransferase